MFKCSEKLVKKVVLPRNIVKGCQIFVIIIKSFKYSPPCFPRAWRWLCRPLWSRWCLHRNREWPCLGPSKTSSGRTALTSASPSARGRRSAMETDRDRAHRFSWYDRACWDFEKVLIWKKFEQKVDYWFCRLNYSFYL